MSLLFNMLPRLVIAFLPKSKHLLISWLQSPSVVIFLEPKKIKSVTVSIVFPSIYHEVMGPDAMIFVFWMSVKPAFSPSSRSSLVPLRFLSLEWCHLHIWGYWCFSWKSWFRLMIHSAQHFTWCTLHKLTSRVTICSLNVLLSKFWISPPFHVWFCCFLTCITHFSGGR